MARWPAVCRDAGPAPDEDRIAACNSAYSCSGNFLKSQRADGLPYSVHCGRKWCGCPPKAPNACGHRAPPRAKLRESCLRKQPERRNNPTHENRHLEHQRRQGAARGRRHLAEGDQPRRRLLPGDQVDHRGVPGGGLRGARLQRRRARPEGLQRRRHPVQAALRRGGRARPAGRRQRQPCPLHRGGGAARAAASCASATSTCPTAIRSAPTSSPTSSPGCSGFEARARDLLELEEPFLLVGDYNVIPEPVDAKNPQAWREDALFQPETRAAFRALLNLGLTDALRACHPGPGVYTFWDYQAGAWQKDHGIRIDHILASPQAADRIAGGRRRQVHARLGEAVRPRAGVGRAGESE